MNGGPSTESNARAIAASKGYELTVEPDGGIVAVGPDGLRYAAAVDWPAMLAWLVRADCIHGNEPGAA